MIKKYFSPIAIISSIFILIFVFYKAEIVNNGTKFYYYKYYYVISFILLLFSFLTLFFSEKVKQYLIIIGFSVLGTFYLYEIYLSLNAYTQITERSRNKIYEEIKAQSDDLVTITVSPGNFLNENLEIFPLSGMSNALTIHCDENGYMSKYKSDRYGFNNPDEEWDKKNIKFFVTGDSIVGGACVNRPDDITSVLRNKTNGGSIQVGYGGNAPLIEYAALREYIDQSMNVENIIWVFAELNDVEGLNHELDNTILKKYTTDPNFTQNLKQKQHITDQIITRYILDKKHYEAETGRQSEFSLQNKIKLFFKLYYLRNSIIKPGVNENFKNIIKLAKQLSDKNGSKLHFVYMPTKDRYTNFYYNNSNYNKIKIMIDDLKINFIDVHEEIFLNEKNPISLFSKYGHYTVSAYEKISDLIIKKSNY